MHSPKCLFLDPYISWYAYFVPSLYYTEPQHKRPSHSLPVGTETSSNFLKGKPNVNREHLPNNGISVDLSSNSCKISMRNCLVKDVYSVYNAGKLYEPQGPMTEGQLKKKVQFCKYL